MEHVLKRTDSSHLEPDPQSKSDELKPVPRPKPDSKMAELTRKLEHLTAKFTKLEAKATQQETVMREKNERLSTELSDLRTILTLLQKVQENLQTDHTKLISDNIKLQADHEKLTNDYIKLQESHRTINTEHTHLQQRFAELKLYLDTFQEEHKELTQQQSRMKEDQDTLKAEVSTMRPDHQAHLSEVGAVQGQEKETVYDTLSTTEDTAYMIDVQPARLLTQVHSLRTNFTHLQSRQDTLQTQVTQIQGAQHTWLTDHQNMKSELTLLQSQHDKLRTGQNDITVDVNDLKSHRCTTIELEQEKLTSDVETLKTQRLALETNLGGARQLFDVGGLDKQLTLLNKTMRFKDIRINDGGHYSPDTGVFTAPCAGLYFLTAVVGSRSQGTVVRVPIVIDDQVHNVLEAGHLGSSWSVMLRLDTGQEVCIRATSVVDHYRHWSYDCPSFSGTLVLPFP